MHTGAVAVVQRADSALRLNVHVHALALDGVYVRDGAKGPLTFHPLAAPTRAHVEDVARRTARRVEKVFQKHGRSFERPTEDDPLPDDQPVLASCYAAAAGGLALAGDRAGRPLLRIVDPLLSRPDEPVGEVSGFNVHAAVAIGARPLPARAALPLPLPASDRAGTPGGAPERQAPLQPEEALERRLRRDPARAP